MGPAVTAVAGVDEDVDPQLRRDRLELLTALIAAPQFDPLYRTDVIRFPRWHPTYWWGCEIKGCEGSTRDTGGLCGRHAILWAAAKSQGMQRGEFASQAEPLVASFGSSLVNCRVCGENRQAAGRTHRLCSRHLVMWDRADKPDLDIWQQNQHPFRSFGPCRVVVCPELAHTPLGLCQAHMDGYARSNSPGGARLPENWFRDLEPEGLPVPVLLDDEVAFHRWCAHAFATRRSGVLNMRGVSSLVAAELKWALSRHAQVGNPVWWRIGSVQHLVELCRLNEVESLFDLAPLRGGTPSLPGHDNPRVRLILREIVDGLRTIYFGPQDARDAGFIELDHFGFHIEYMHSCYDLSGVSQRWLRDLLWDDLAQMMQSPPSPQVPGAVRQRPPRIRDAERVLGVEC